MKKPRHRQKRRRVEVSRVIDTAPMQNTIKADENEIIVPIPMPVEMYRTLNKTLQLRQLKLGDFLRLSLRSMLSNNKIYGLNDKLRFGKYNGERMEYVIRAAPDYIQWAIRSIEGFGLTEPAQMLLDNIITSMLEARDDSPTEMAW